MDAAVHQQPLHLVEARRMGGVGVVLAERLARGDDLERRLVLQHVADLHRRGVRAQHHVVEALQEERVLLVAGRVELGDVQLGEVVVLQLDLGPDGDLVAEVQEKLLDLALDVGDQVEAADGQVGGGQRRVKPCAGAGRGGAFLPGLAEPRSTNSLSWLMAWPAAGFSAGAHSFSLDRKRLTTPFLRARYRSFRAASVSGD